MTSHLIILLLALPWLNPLTYGPTSPVVQFLSVWMGVALCTAAWELGHVDTSARIRAVTFAWLLAAAASACMGLLQYLGAASPLSPWVNYVDAGQAYANLRQRNQLATLLAIGFCALLWWQMQQPSAEPTRARRWLWHWAMGVAVMLLATADAASGSRTGMLQLVLLLALALVWRRGRVTLVLALSVYAAAAVALPLLAGLDPLHSGILGRVGEAAAPCSSRLSLWSNVLHLIAQKPWTGWGWGELSYAHFMTLYPGERFCEILGNAHNLPLHLAVELGIPVAVLVCGALLWWVLRGKPWCEQDATRQMAWSVLMVIGVHSLLEYPLWYAPFQLAALLAIWLLWCSRPPRSPGPSTGNYEGTTVAVTASAAKAWPAALAGLVLLACSYAAWDYWRISQIYIGEAQRADYYREDTLEKIRPSWLFSDQVRFAELGITPLTPQNASYMHALALNMLHFSPESSVVEKAIASAEMLGLTEEAEAFKQRYQAAYPAQYAAWVQAQAVSPRP